MSKGQRDCPHQFSDRPDTVLHTVFRRERECSHDLSELSRMKENRCFCSMKLNFYIEYAIFRMCSFQTHRKNSRRESEPPFQGTDMDKNRLRSFIPEVFLKSSRKLTWDFPVLDAAHRPF